MSPKSAQSIVYLATATANCYLTQADGWELAQLGLISVDATSVDPENPQAYLVRLTDAGIAAAMDPSVVALATPAPVAVAPAPFVLVDSVPLPKLRGAASPKEAKEKRICYPFDTMLVNQSFHVAVTADTPEPWKTMNSNVSAAIRKFMVEAVPQEIVTTEHEKLVKDENGEAVIGTDGKKVYEKYTKTAPKMVETKRFVARRVDEKDPSGVGARVWRIA